MGSSLVVEFVENLEDIVRNLEILLIFVAIATFILLSKRFRPLLIGLVVMDLFWFGSGLNPLISQSIYRYRPSTLEFVKREEGSFRLMLTPRTEIYNRWIRGTTGEEVLMRAKGSLVPNLGMLDHLFDAYGYTSLKLNDYISLLDHIKGSPYKEIAHLLNLLNIRYIISKWELNIEGLELAFKNEAMIYLNNSVLPRAFLVPSAIGVEGKEKAFRRVTSQGFDPRDEVVLEGKTREGGGRGRCKMIEYGPNMVKIEVSSDGPSFLFLSDTYYPGWEAYIDGVRTHIYRANYCFRAVRVPSGEHIVKFVYRPLSFRVGVIGSIITVLLILGFGVHKRWRG
jgi:hypothetical protein